MTEIDMRDDKTNQVSESVAHALALVGPSERGAERTRKDRPPSEPVEPVG